MLAELDRLLVDDATDRWVVVTGGPAMGKSAILAAWLLRREAAGAVVPHHFIRRGQYGWDEPATIVRSLEARDVVLTRLDLDDPAADDDNAATVRAFWRREAISLELDDRFVKEAVARADGNLQHAATLRKHLENVPPAQRRVEAIPRGLKSLLTMLWRRIASDAVAVRELGVLCAAREPLSLDELGAVAGWNDAAQRQTFVQAVRELLVEMRREDGLAEYRLHHDSIRGHIVEQLGPAAIRGHHAALAQKFATWPAPADAAARRYALRHAIAHRVEAGDWTAVGQVACDFGFLEAKCCELGVHYVEADMARAAERCRAQGDEAITRDLGDRGRRSHRHHRRPAPPRARRRCATSGTALRAAGSARPREQVRRYDAGDDLAAVPGARTGQPDAS